ncbi:hypothetical protein B484DRAFT_404752 [Ochromonadaceae sp. CCMP2298]|nr:hypothetical protein B484DRAFT_404752 [Ochromonadaceae sp. CCMP2298]
MAIVGYSLCSSTLLLANKLAMEHMTPSAVSLLQIIFSTLAVMGIKLLGLSQVDWFEWEKAKAYSLYVVIFVAAIYCNMQALRVSNVETVIVFRACSPIAVCAVDYLFMDRDLPTARSALSLLVVATGAILYCVSDSQLALDGLKAYYWVVIYFFLITLEMTYGKVLTSNVKMDSVWGPVLYCNAFSVLPMLLISSASNDQATILPAVQALTPSAWGVLLFSCVVGTLIGYTGWLCRSMVSATSFTLVGVVNKFLTVLLNVVAWDKHSTPAGLVAVCLCLLAGSFYQQAPRRSRSKEEEGGEGGSVQATIVSYTPTPICKGVASLEIEDDRQPLIGTK